MPRGSKNTETPADDGRVKRNRRSPAERAQADLAKAQERFDKAQAKLTEARAAVEAADSEIKRAEHYLNFAKSNPDLPPGAVDEAEEQDEDSTGNLDVPDNAADISQPMTLA